MSYSSPFKNTLPLDLWSDGDFRNDSCLPFSLNLCKTPGNYFPIAFSRVAKGWKVMLESQDFQAGQWVVLEVAFSFTCRVSFESYLCSALKDEPRLSSKAKDWLCASRYFHFILWSYSSSFCLLGQVSACWLSF